MKSTWRCSKIKSGCRQLKKRPRNLLAHAPGPRRRGLPPHLPAGHGQSRISSHVRPDTDARWRVSGLLQRAGFVHALPGSRQYPHCCGVNHWALSNRGYRAFQSDLIRGPDRNTNSAANARPDAEPDSGLEALADGFRPGGSAPEFSSGSLRCWRIRITRARCGLTATVVLLLFAVFCGLFVVMEANAVLGRSAPVLSQPVVISAHAVPGKVNEYSLRMRGWDESACSQRATSGR